MTEEELFKTYDWYVTGSIIDGRWVPPDEVPDAHL